MPQVTAVRLRKLLSYDPESGLMAWACFRAPGFHPGDRAGTIDNRGYRVIKLDGKSYKEHRLVWLYMTGKWPTHEVDHINLDKGDNRWINLRAASRHQNRCNVPRYKNNSSGHKGVYWLARNKKWAAQINIGGKQTYLGLFLTMEAAVAVYNEAALRHHGMFARVTTFA